MNKRSTTVFFFLENEEPSSVYIRIVLQTSASLMA